MTIKSAQTLVAEALKQIKTVSPSEALKMSNDGKCNLIDIRDVRELENTLQRALVLCEGDKITKTSIMIDKSLNNMSSDGQVESFIDRYNYA